jgi:arabinoxylan arabinofuranohydrolase
MTAGIAVNPFLPLHEYIPDGEPHVFGDRVFLIGSHDQEGGDAYCTLDYVFYSAPINDLSSWTSKGVNYRPSQDPTHTSERSALWAPDVVQGNDGRYYLYYCLGGKEVRKGWEGPIGVAVADEPDGKYEFLGHIRNVDGSIFNEYVLFDPAVINDDGTIRLYYGFCLPLEKLPTLFRPLTRRLQASLFSKTRAQMKSRPDSIQGAFTVDLSEDMLTVVTRPSRVMPVRSKGTRFDGHAFFEGSSVRKINGTYYFVYSSSNAHELCYATSAHPDRGFTFRGTIISNGDIGYEGRTPKERTNRTGNNHGGIERIGNKWYVFYHRHTHQSNWSRQACAEEITILADGSIAQVPVTSAGLNGGPLPATGRYPAVICSSLSNGKMPHGSSRGRKIPEIVHQGEERYIRHITNGTSITYKYFQFEGQAQLTVTTRAHGNGQFVVKAGETVVGTISILPSTEWQDHRGSLDTQGTSAITLTFKGTGSVELLTVALS